MLVVPSPQYVTIAISIKLSVLVVIAMLAMALAMPLSLRERDAAAGKKHRYCDGGNPSSYFHENSCLGGLRLSLGRKQRRCNPRQIVSVRGKEEGLDQHIAIETER